MRHYSLTEEYRKCIKCKKDMGYYYLTPTKCTDCWVEESTDRMIQVMKESNPQLFNLKQI